MNTCVETIDEDTDMNTILTIMNNLRSPNSLCKYFRITGFDFNDNEMQIYAKALSNTLKANNSIKSITIKNIDIISKENIQYILEGIILNKTIEEIIFLQDGFIDEDIIIQFLEAIMVNSSIKIVNLVIIDVSDKIIEACGNILKRNQIINNFIFEDMNISNLGLQYICDGLKVNNNLKYLSIPTIYTNKEGFNIISQILEQNETLECLDLSRGNYLSEEDDEGYIVELPLAECEENIALINLEAALINNKSLKELYLRNCNINDKGMLILHNILKKMSIL
jgi:hypothetical protein